MNRYGTEVRQRWGETAAYREYAAKTADYAADRWERAADGLDDIFARFAACLKSGCAADSVEAQTLAKELQNHITAHYYTCTDEMLVGLGKMYVADERFRANIDRHAIGTADLVARAIDVYRQSHT